MKMHTALEWAKPLFYLVSGLDSMALALLQKKEPHALWRPGFYLTRFINTCGRGWASYTGFCNILR